MAKSKKIAYDLDGVLISDLKWPSDMSLQEFLEMRRSEPIANFVPKGEYYIITGRNYTDSTYTFDWINDNLSSNLPVGVFHECEDYRKGEVYKSSVINLLDIDVFVESCPKQVKYLKENCPNCQVYHFSEYVSEALSKL